jgi:hypothetical protein
VSGTARGFGSPAGTQILTLVAIGLRQIMLRTIFTILILGLQSFAFGQSVTGQVFMLTERFSDDNCEVVAQCDCCSTDLFFLTDKDFALVNRCLYNDSYFKGTYTIKNSKLILNFRQKEVTEIINEQTNQKNNVLKKLKIDPHVFSLTMCDKKVRLIHETIKDFKNGTRHKLTKEKELQTKLNRTQAWKLVSE